MAYLFTPPTVLEAPGWGHRLFANVGIPRGVTLLVTGPTVVEARFPTIEEQRDADRVYLGGHRYDISDDEALILIEAGYASGLERVDTYVDIYEDIYGGDLLLTEGG